MARVRVRLPNRPATATPSDSEDQTEEPEDELLLPVGAEAELRIDDPGLLGSFYEVTVTGHLASCGRYRVLYSTLVADNAGPLEETAAAADVRPRPPPSARREFALHEAVEAFHNDGWWAGVVSAVPPPGRPRVYEVVFPTSRERMDFHDTDLRPHRVFKAGRWVPAAEAEDGSPLFREGDQIEVSRSAKSFGESWSPASVLKVFGATNLLVKYTHVGEDEEAATEIIDSQYIRPARTDTRMDSKYRISRSSHVEVMHEGSWWPGVIQEVLGSGSGKKYAVKLKSFETDMDDVECLDTLIVGNTQLRQHFDWDGERWVRRLTEEFVNGTKLTSRKRPSSYALSSYKEVSESTDKNGSCRGKKLKSADVVSEPTSPLLYVCFDKYEIMHKSSSYPEETMKQGNEVVALGSPLLPSMEGFAHLSDCSLAQSILLEQASSQNIITTSAPGPQSPQLQASMLGTFGQPRLLLEGPLLEMQSLNPHTPKKGIDDESIEEARNIVSMSEDVTKPKNGVDDVELRYNLTAGHGMISEIDEVVNSVDLTTTTPKDIGGSQHGGGSGVDDGVSESAAVDHLPFVKSFPLWSRIEAMEVFRKGPQQRPHLNQLQPLNPELREGMAFGLMLCFANVAESINMLDVEDDNEVGVLEEKMQVLPLLEANGFEVGALQSRLQTLLQRKNSRRAERHYDAMKALGEKISLKETEDREVGVRIRVLALAARDLEIYARLMRGVMRSAVGRKVKNAVEMARLKAEAKELERSAELEFGGNMDALYR